MKIKKSDLAAILREAAEEIIKERETDSAYTKLVDLFIKAWLEPGNLTVGEKQTSKTLNFRMHKALKKLYKKSPALGRKWDNQLGKVLELKPEVVDDMVDRAAKIEGIEKIFPAVGYGLPGLFQTKVNIVYEDENPALKTYLGWFDTSDGEVNINFAAPQIRNSFNTTATRMDRIPDSQFAIAILQNGTALFQTFQHEMTHMINYHRRGAQGVGGQSKIYTKAIQKAWTAASGQTELNPLIKRSIRYANSTEEMQARLIHIFNDLEKTVILGKEGESWIITRPMVPAGESIVKTKQTLDKLFKVFEMAINSGKKIDNKMFVNLISLVIGIYDIYYPHFVPVKTDKIRKRMAGRIYDFVGDMISKYGAGE